MRFKYFLLIFLLLIAVRAVTQNDVRLNISPEKPEAGVTLELSYTPLPAMKGNGSVRGMAYTYQNFRWYGHDIPLSLQGQVYKGTFVTPNDAAFVAFQFLSDSITDHNGAYPYVTVLYDNKGARMPGSYVAWALLRSKEYDGGIPGYIDFNVYPSVSDTVVYYWVNNEVNHNAVTAVKLVPLYVRSMHAAGIKDANQTAERVIAYLLGTGSEQALSAAVEILRPYNPAKADSVKTVLLEQYPTCLEALRNKYYERVDYTDKDAVRTHLITLLRDFPYTPQRDEYLSRYGHGYDNVLLSLILMDAAEGKQDTMEKYLPMLSVLGAVNAFYKLVNVPYIRKDKTADELLPQATAIMNHINAHKGERPYNLSYLTPAQWKEQVSKMINTSYVAHTYSRILSETGNNVLALEYARKAQSECNYTNAEVNENMALLLCVEGMDNELNELLAKSVYNNQMTLTLDSLLCQTYLDRHGSIDGYSAYVESLRNPSVKGNIQKEVQRYRRFGMMPSWTLTDTKGNNVTSDQMRGKVYVLDFWATWCVPCKASLPGMKRAADYFKDDPNVEFLFVDTQEQGKDYKVQAEAYLKSMNLDLKLLFDQTTPDSTTNNALCETLMEMFSVSGIPLKIVVDGSGNVCFISVGYKGSPSALADEMIEMVEQAKNSQKYTSQEVFYYNDTISFGATLTVPITQAKPPVVVLLSGTGKQDRSGTMAGHALFATIADFLSSRGIAVLRSDDRGTGASTGVYEISTTYDFAMDALAAVNYLKTRNDIDTARIGLLGHSEGGATMAIVASMSKDVKFMISLAGLCSDGLTALLSQNEALVRASALSENDKKRSNAVNELMFRVAYKYAMSDSLEHMLTQTYKAWAVTDSIYFSTLGIGYDHFRFPIYSYIRQAISPWYRFFLRYNPLAYLKDLRIPLLAINGEKDLMVDPDVNLTNWKNLMPQDADVTLLRLPNLNHLFLPCQTGTPSEYRQIKESFSIDALNAIYNWLKDRQFCL